MKKTYEDLKKVLDSKIVSTVLRTLGVLLLVMIIFSAGVAVGFRKASFYRAWGEHYTENFGGFRGDMSGGFDAVRGLDQYPNAHGTTGKIVKLELPNIIVEDRDGTEKTIMTGIDTDIRQGRADLKAEELKTNDFVVVIGSPSQTGTIDAKIIRLIPKPEFLK